MQRSTCQYEHRRADDAEFVARLRELAAERPRFGYRRLHALLRREVRHINRELVYRIYKKEGLAVRRRTRRKLRASRPKPVMPVARPNERWSMDFVHDYLGTGRRFRSSTAKKASFPIGPMCSVLGVHAVDFTHGWSATCRSARSKMSD